MSSWLDGRVEIVQADITTLDVDVIVNAANASLCGGGGVDGAIHRAAGPELLVECRGLGGARPGEVKLTKGYDLPARFVAHAVGPIWGGGHRGEAELLASCYREALALALEADAKTIAFPAISTGAYGYPLREATEIALDEVARFLGQNPLEKVVMCCFSASDLEVYERVAQATLGPSDAE